MPAAEPTVDVRSTVRRRRPGRGLRRFARRPRAMQLRTLGAGLVVAAGIAVYLAGAPAAVSGAPSSSAVAAATPEARASTSARGVSAHSINVMFPVVALNSLAGKLGFASDAEFGAQAEAIRLYVGQINKAGGINGRKINPIIQSFDPEDEAAMRALCEDWTQGNPAAFAVLDGEGTWTGDDQLCITQEGHTPLISQWTTTTNWTRLGSPYLWWTGPDDATILQAVVNWGLSAGLLGPGHHVGVIAGDRVSDQDALHQYLLPDLARAGVTPVVETIAAEPSESATTAADAPIIIQKLRSAGVTSVIPLVPFNVFYPILQAQSQQAYYPRLLLSDYELSIESSLGLIPVPYEKVLDGQEGVTTETLGGFDDNRPQSEGGYDPGVRSCYDTWHAAHPRPLPGATSAFIEEQGPIAAWCGVIRLFAAAAKAAGPDLNRRTFVEAMARIKNFPGTLSPVLTYGPDKFSGPTQYQVVKLHNNVPATSACKLKTNHQPQGTCWVTVDPFSPLPPG